MTENTASAEETKATKTTKKVKKGAKKGPKKASAPKKPTKKVAKKPAKKVAKATKKPVKKAAKAGTKTAAPQNRRGAPDVIEKRRIAREFNSTFGGDKKNGAKFDGRVRNRCLRILNKLSEPSNLKPLALLKNIDALLENGFPRSQIRGVMPKGAALQSERVTLDVLRALHGSYGFRYDTYRIAGFKTEKLEKAGIAA